MRSVFWRPRGGRTYVLAGLVLASTALLAACSRPAEPAPSTVAVPRPALPAQEPLLSRADILAAAGQAASAHAAGGPPPAPVTRLTGRRFQVALPFGCDGPSETSPEGYTVSRDGRSMTLTVQPQAWTGAFWLTALADGSEVEAAEGFWIRRPWLAGEACPGKVPAASDAVATPETVGLVRVFETGGSRLNRRGDRPYRITVRTEPDAHLSLSGFRLVLEGRVAEADGRPLRCRSRSVDERPVCLVRVNFERISMQSADGAILAEWRE